MIPMIIMAFLVATTLIVATTAAGSAFLAQRDLQAVCDGAALAGAQALDFGSDRTVTEQGAAGSGDRAEYVPVAAVQQAVDDYIGAANADGGARVGTETVVSNGITVSLTCHSHPSIALGRVVGHGDGIDRNAHASARAAVLEQ